jgi:hypothetical protein
MGAHSTLDISKSDAISQVTRWLEEKKDRIVRDPNSLLTRALTKFEAEKARKFLLDEPLNEAEWEALKDSIPTLSREELEVLLDRLEEDLYNYNVIEWEH